MPRDISLILNDPRTELRRSGWSCLRVGSAFRGAALTYRKFADGVCRKVFTPADLSPDVWQEPDTGYVMLRPSSLRDDFSEIFPGARIGLDDLFVPPDWSASGQSGAWFDEPGNPKTGKPKMITLSKPDSTTVIPDLAGVPPYYLEAMQSNAFDMGFKAATVNPLMINEGFAITLLPEGIPTDRASAWFGVAFGNRFYLQIGMNGQAALYEYGTPDCTDAGEATWIRRARFEYAQGHADKDPFQVTVIPWGLEFLTFLFSQSKQSNRRHRGNTGKTSIHSFTYSLSASSGEIPRFDATHNHHIKLEPAPLLFAMRHLDYQYALAISRVRYVASNFALLPEMIDEPKPIGAPAVDCIGFRPAGATAEAGILNDDGNAWDATANVRFSPQISLTPGASGVYTPEVWGLECEIDPEIFTSTNQSTDISEFWTSLNWRETTHPDASEIKIVLRRDTDIPALLKRDGCVRIDIDGEQRVHGYLREQRPHADGGRGTVRDQWVGDDAWERLNSTTVAFFKSFTRMKVGQLLLELFYRAGFLDAEIDIDPELYDIEIAGFEKESDWKIPGEEVTAGDLVRELVRIYGMQGRDTLRVFRLRGRWRCYLATAFLETRDAMQPGTAPDLVFVMDSSLMGVNQMPDIERYLAVPPILKVLTGYELYIKRPAFNSASFFGVDDPSEQANLLAAFIAADPASLTDAARADYNQRIRHKTFGPQEMGHVSTQSGLERRARKAYDEEMRRTRVWTHAGEWQPYVEPDMFAWIVGIEKDSKEPVSYGMWRIEESDITIDYDHLPEKGNLNRRWSWAADYTLSWAGVYVADGYPMFTSILPDPL